MESRLVADATAAAHVQQRWSCVQPASRVFQTLRPCFPLTLPYDVAVPGPSYLAACYGGVVVPSQVIPSFYHTVIGNSNTKERRKSFLDRSLFDLVHAHPYLPLTDPKLLGWYLCLSPEDRKIIQDEGGFHQFLQRHPALELSKHHVYVKYNSGVQPTVTSKQTSITPGPRLCRCEMCHTDLEIEMLTSTEKENLTMLDCTSRRTGSQKQLCEEVCHTKQLVHQQDSFPTGHSSPITQESKSGQVSEGTLLFQLKQECPSQQMSSNSRMLVCKDPATLASFSLDVELERCRQRGRPEHQGQMLMTEDQTDNFTFTEVRPLQSEWSTVETASPEYDSFDSIDSIINDGTRYNYSDVIQSAEFEQLNSPVDPAEAQDYMVYDVGADDSKAFLSLEHQSKDLLSIMEEDKSVLVCVAGDGQTVHASQATSSSAALAAITEVMKSDQPVYQRNTEEKSTSPMACVPTCDAVVGTELTLCVSAFTQTDEPKTTDKHVVTEVHMADLDYLALEFLKLKSAQEELKEKEKIKSLGCKEGNCDCFHRAQQAELTVLTLQYDMCRQHCWRLYCTIAEGEHFNPMTGDTNQYRLKDPPANVLSVLQKLRSDYDELRDKILKGVPLEQLKPLSIDSGRITTAATYIPAQIAANVRGSVLPRCPQDLQRPSASADKNGCLDNKSTNGCQKNDKQVDKDNGKARRAVALVPQDRGATHDAHKLTESQTSAACKELTAGEAWYDAEEHLESAEPAEPAEPAAAAETGQNSKVTAEVQIYGSASKEAPSSVLSSSNLTSKVTRSDGTLPFEKCHGSEVNSSASHNGLRVQPAEAAAREVNGSSVQGRTSCEDHISRADGGSQRQASASISGCESSQDPTTPQTPKTNCCSGEVKLTAQPPLASSTKTKQVVCVCPTAKGTCVPQHYGTMGGFDTLMGELTRRHPDAGRQRIVDALVELRAKHQRVLSGFPLRIIREMASELLTRPVSSTQL